VISLGDSPKPIPLQLEQPTLAVTRIAHQSCNQRSDHLVGIIDLKTLLMLTQQKKTQIFSLKATYDWDCQQETVKAR
jgi:hypothetical protein